MMVQTFLHLKRRLKSVPVIYITLGGIIKFFHFLAFSKTHKHLSAVATHGFCKGDQNKVIYFLNDLSCTVTMLVKTVS